LGRGVGRRIRYGGDEFVLWHDDLESGKQIRDALDARLKNVKLRVVDDNGVESTIEGLSVSHGTGGTFDEADAALYANKELKSEQGLRPPMGEGVDKNTLAEGIKGLTRKAPLKDRRLGNAADLARQKGPRYSNVSDIPPDVARKAFEAQAATKGTKTATKAAPKVAEAVAQAAPAADTPNFIADVY
jgi:hypothetical protein